jgi:hypothetical protein
VTTLSQNAHPDLLISHRVRPMPPRNVNGMQIETPAGRDPNGLITSDDAQRVSAERTCFEGGTCYL